MLCDMCCLTAQHHAVATTCRACCLQEKRLHQNCHVDQPEEHGKMLGGEMLVEIAHEAFGLLPLDDVATSPRRWWTAHMRHLDVRGMQITLPPARLHAHA